MAYSDFTLDEVVRRLGVTTAPGNLFPDLPPVTVPDWLRAALGRNTLLAFLNEKSRSESVVSPVLTAAREVSGDKLAVFSGQRLDADPTRGLVGDCDFILALAPPVQPLRAPIATLVEAKRGDVESGLGQCVAEMVGAKAFNEAAGEGRRPVFGCVTSGEVWQFLRLDGATAVQDYRRYTLAELGLILAGFRAMVMACEAATPAAT